MDRETRQLLHNKNETVTTMRNMILKAEKENRGLTKAERDTYDGLNLELDKINLQLQDKIDDPDNDFSFEGMRRVDDDGTEIVSQDSLILNTKNINDFRRRFTGNSKGLDFGNFAKGILFNDWKGAEDIQAMVTNKVDGSVITPPEIVSDIIYAATNRSVLLNNCPILPMKEGTSIIGKIKDNVDLDFKKPYELGKETGLGLEGVTLNAKTLYSWIEISEEDLQDINNLEDIIREAFGGAVAETLDKNFLYNGTVDPEKETIYPKGILDNPNILNVTVDTVDYDMVGKASLAISKENGGANTVALNPQEFYNLQMLKDSNGQYIQPPMFWEELKQINSNSIKPNDGLVFDGNQIVIGIRRDMDIKVLPDLKKGTVLLRCMFRADVAATRENHICKLVINPGV